MKRNLNLPAYFTGEQFEWWQISPQFKRGKADHFSSRIFPLFFPACSNTWSVQDNKGTLHGSILLISYRLFFEFCRLNSRFGKQKPSWHVLNALQYYLSRYNKSCYQDFHMMFQFIFTLVSASAILIPYFLHCPSKDRLHETKAMSNNICGFLQTCLWII